MSEDPAAGTDGFGRSVTRESNDINRFISRYRDYFAGLQLLPGLFWLAFFFGISFVIIVIYSLLLQAPPEGAFTFTLENYREFLFDSFYTGILWESFIIGVKVTVASLIVAYPVGYFLAFTESSYKNVLVLLIILPFWINIVVRTYAWRLILGRNGVINYLFVDITGLWQERARLLFSQDAIVLGLAHVFLPFMLLPIYTSLNRFDRTQIEAAKNLGANRLQAFYEITLPQSLPGVAGGVALVFVLAFGSFLVPLMLGGQRNVMIANIVADMFGPLQDWALGSAMAVVLTVICLALVYLFNEFIGLSEIYGSSEEP